MKVFSKWMCGSRRVHNVDDISHFVTTKSKLHQISTAIKNISYYLMAFLLAPGVSAAPLTIIPNAPGNLVTAGIPFAACALPDVSQFRLLNEAGAEIPIFIKPTLFWPASRCNGVATVRAIKIQFAYNAAQGQKVYNWQLASRSMPDLAEASVEEVVSGNPARAPYKEPAFFAISAPAYLVTTGLIPPTTVAGDSDYDKVWYPAAFNKRVNTIDFATTTGENWLFDSVSSIYQQALRSGSVEQYREAYLEHEFYMGNMETVDQATDAMDASRIGRWRLAVGDIKYVYLTPMKLHLALTGDDSWRPSENGVPHETSKDRDTFIRTIATKALAAQAIRAPYTDTTVRFTERETGFAFQQLLAAYELTSDPALLTTLNKAVDNLYGMMTSNPDGLGNNGYLSHSWDTHEGDIPVYLGMSPNFADSRAEATQTFTTMTVSNILAEDYKKLNVPVNVGFKPYGPPNVPLAQLPAINADGTLTLTFANPVSVRSSQYVMVVASGMPSNRKALAADRAFSPWMQAVVADGLWQFYNLTSDTAVKSRISELLLGFGQAITAYAIDGNGLDPEIKSQIESAFGVRVAVGATSGSRGIVPYTRYVANALMGGEYATRSYISYMEYDGGFSDQHSPEALFQIALALRFETDSAKKAAMQSVASQLAQWFAAKNQGKTILSSHPARYFNWTNKQNAWGTYEAIESGVPEYPRQ